MAEDLVAFIKWLVAQRGAPVVRMEDASEFVAWARPDCCRLAGTGAICIEPGSPPSG